MNLTHISIISPPDAAVFPLSRFDLVNVDLLSYTAARAVLLTIDAALSFARSGPCLSV